MRGDCGRLLGRRQRDGDGLRRAGRPRRNAGARRCARAGERGDHGGALAGSVDQPQQRQLHVRRAHVLGKAQDQRAGAQVQGGGACQPGRGAVGLDAHALPGHLGDAIARKVPDRVLADAEEQLPALGGRGAVRQHGLGPLGGRQFHYGGIWRGDLPDSGAGQVGQARTPDPAAAGCSNADLRQVDPGRIDGLGKPQAELAGVQVEDRDHRGRQRGWVGVAGDVERQILAAGKLVSRQVADGIALDIQADGRGRRVGAGNPGKVAVVQDEHHRCAAASAVRAAHGGAGKRRPARAVVTLDRKPRRVDGLRVDVLVEPHGERPGGKVEQGARLRILRAARQHWRGGVGPDRQRGGIRRIDGRRRPARQVRERGFGGRQPHRRAGQMRGNSGRLLGGRQRDDDRPRRVRRERQLRVRPRPRRVRPRGRRRAQKPDAERLQRLAGGAPRNLQPLRACRRRIDVLVEPHGQRAGPQVQLGRPSCVERRAGAVGQHLKRRRSRIVRVVRQVGERAGGHFQARVGIGGQGQHGGPLALRKRHLKGRRADGVQVALQRRELYEIDAGGRPGGGRRACKLNSWRRCAGSPSKRRVEGHGRRRVDVLVQVDQDRPGIQV